MPTSQRVIHLDVELPVATASGFGVDPSAGSLRGSLRSPSQRVMPSTPRSLKPLERPCGFARSSPTSSSHRRAQSSSMEIPGIDPYCLQSGRSPLERSRLISGSITFESWSSARSSRLNMSRPLPCWLMGSPSPCPRSRSLALSTFSAFGLVHKTYALTLACNLEWEVLRRLGHVLAWQQVRAKQWVASITA
jgi:hypothetical protein